ncbi:MAG: tetratricopeptide repeat protein [Alphaproteobacteria bacterium PRO2]|nr:tetratricopeptide repeat protein [Alphaproteobacteria bacterium PRO2]
MDMRKVGIGFCGILGVCAAFYSYSALTTSRLASLQTMAGQEYTIGELGPNVFGDYLSSQFAQQHHDWKRAGDYLTRVMIQTPDDPQVLKRAMILAMGAGETDKSVELAARVAEVEKDNALALLFLTTGAMHNKDYAAADKYLKTMPEGSLSDFIMPLLESWIQAGLGNYTGDKLTGNTAHMYHAILLADYMGKKDEIKKLLEKILEGKAPADAERIADIYAHAGETEQAIGLYTKLLQERPADTELGKKLADVQTGKIPDSFERVTSPEQGVAMALYNMSELLYQEHADDSARVFANIALYLDPAMTDTQLLLAAITSRNDRMNDAIGYYRSVKPESEYYLESRRRAADLLEDSKRTDEALAELNSLVKNHNDVESLIRIGDIYRRQEDFQKALVSYNEAAARFGDKIPKEYWHLLYARGMSLERLGEWDKAETDLRAALSYQPDHPYVLNYLGYAWTDQGVNLHEALTMIKKAAELRPTDGYIADSLGWVYYRMANYKEAVPSLEAAVELLPYDPVINDHLGDAYWQAGRKLEARFQWQRARNYSEDQSLNAMIDQKLAQGLITAAPVKHAHSAEPVTTHGPNTGADSGIMSP